MFSIRAHNLALALATASCAIATVITAGAAFRSPPPPTPIAIALPAAPAASADKPDAGVFTVSGTASLEALPDVADLRATLAVERHSAAEAVRELRSREAGLAAALGVAHVRGEDRAMSRLRIDPVVDKAGAVVRYRAALDVKVTTESFDDISLLLEVMVRSGATGVVTDLRVADVPALKKKVRAEAAAAAREKAAELAASVGFERGKVRSVIEEPGGNWGWNGIYANIAMVEDAPPTTHGELITVAMTVTVIYEIE